MSHLKVVDFPTNSLADLPQKLRDIAEAIEEGVFGEPKECIIVLNAASLEVFGVGAEADGTVAHYLLACAQRKLENALVNHE